MELRERGPEEGETHTPPAPHPAHTEDVHLGTLAIAGGRRSADRRSDDLLPVGRDEPELWIELRCLAIDVMVAPLLVGGEVVTPMVEEGLGQRCVRPGRVSLRVERPDR